MLEEAPLSIFEISRELRIGTASTKFLLNRFNRWVNWTTEDGKLCYPRETVGLLLKIKNELDKGTLPTEVEEKLENNQLQSLPAEPVVQTPKGMELDDILSGLQAICQYQDRIASSHESQVKIEERKAQAMEKRAEAECRKAEAMENIASALQNMGPSPGFTPENLAPAQEGLQAIQTDFAPPAHSPELTSGAQGNEITPRDDLSDLVNGDKVPEINSADPEIQGSDPTLDMLDKMAADAIENVVEDMDLDDLSLLVASEPDTEEKDDDVENILDAPPLSDMETDALDQLIDDVSTEAP
ncbi:MAG: hypothetical protein MI747_22940, partial [Desulfobacterales bacterium]|nr:hypothetical protein [Desulfobacterales bacterium]